MRSTNLRALNNIMEIAIEQLHDYVQLVGGLPDHQILQRDDVCVLT